MAKRILLATGIFPPDIGGPALYSQKLAEEFSKRGVEAPVLAYGKSGVSRIWPAGIRQLIYFLKLRRLAKSSDAIFAFDSLGVGLPAVLAGKLLKKKVVIRLGGDFLWEKYIEACLPSGTVGRGRVTMEEFYQKNLQNEFSFLFRLIKFTLRNADLVAFTTDFQRDIFIPHYGLDLGKTVIVSNVFEKISGEIPGYRENPKVVLWAGRFIKLKNLEFLVRVFKRLLAYDKNLILKLIGDGPEKRAVRNFVRLEDLEEKVKLIDGLDEGALSEEIKNSYFCVLPSLSEVSPNFALKCLAMNKPIILTWETGIRKDFPGLMYADPKKEDSFFQSALRLLDWNSYENYQKFIADIRHQKTWRDLADEYLNLLSD
jgi:glycosyltransferase involved in cell wall biosynthesis